MYVQSAQDVQRELRKSLKFPERLYNQFSREELTRYAQRVLEITQERNNYLEENPEAQSSLGLGCASPLGAARSYFFSLMTAAAAKTASRRLQRPLTVVELGAGSGIHAITALLATPDSRVIAYEKNPHAARFARKMSQKYGLTDSLELREEDFLTADFSNICADVVVNENLNQLLLGEPQLYAAQRILPYTHPKTSFVPRGVRLTLKDVTTGMNKSLIKSLYLGEIDFRKRQDSIELSTDLEPTDLESEELHFDAKLSILDSQGTPHHMKNAMGMFPLDALVRVTFSSVTPASDPCELVFSRPIQEPLWMHRLCPNKCFSVRKKGYYVHPRWKEIDARVMGYSL